MKLINLTRFSPSPNGRMHLGHLWCAFVNWALGADEGIILRFEDLTVLRTNNISLLRLKAYESDFRVNLERFGIPILKEIRQTDKESRYEELNNKHFSGLLKWNVQWDETRYEHDAPALGYNRSSPGLAMLSRVVDDHDEGIHTVIRGAELQWERPLYTWFFKLAFPDDYRQTMPVQRYIAPIFELMADGSEQKMSKSITRSTFLSDVEIDPWGTIRGLCLNQMRGNQISGPLWEVHDMTSLRQWVGLAAPVADPIGITMEDVRRWS